MKKNQKASFLIFSLFFNVLKLLFDCFWTPQALTVLISNVLADITKLSQNQLQTNLTKECRELAQISQSVSTASPAEIPELQKDSVATFQRLCNVSTHAHKIADSEVAANSIQGKTR